MKTNNIYLYDGSFLNLLNLIKILITKQIIPHNIKDTTYQPNLFDEIISLSIPNADIFNEIIKSTSKEIFNTLYLIFCSTNENKEIIIYYFFGVLKVIAVGKKHLHFFKNDVAHLEL